MVKYTHQSFDLIKPTPLILKASFLDLHLSISNDIVSGKINYNSDDYDFEYIIFSIFRL